MSTAPYGPPVGPATPGMGLPIPGQDPSSNRNFGLGFNKRTAAVGLALTGLVGTGAVVAMNDGGPSAPEAVAAAPSAEDALTADTTPSTEAPVDTEAPVVTDASTTTSTTEATTTTSTEVVDESRGFQAEDLSGIDPENLSDDDSRAIARGILNPDSPRAFYCVEDATDSVTRATLESGREIVVPKVNSLLPVQAGVISEDSKMFSDGMSHALVSDLENNEETNAEIYDELCENGMDAVTLAHALANYPIGNITLADESELLAPYKDLDVAELNDIAESFMPYYRLELEEGTPEFEEALAAHNEHMELAEGLVEILEGFNYNGVVSARAQENYHLANGGQPVDRFSFPEIEMDKPYTGYFGEFESTLKIGEGELCVATLGKNVTEQRWAVLGPENCGPDTPPLFPPAPEAPPETPPTGTNPPEVVTPKIDGGRVPGAPIPADRDPGTPGRPGEGPAGQPVDETTGTIATEDTVPDQIPDAPVVTEAPAPVETPPAVTTPDEDQPVADPVPIDTSPATTVIEGTTPLPD